MIFLLPDGSGHLGPDHRLSAHALDCLAIVACALWERTTVFSF
jgi:hypothetical protein